MLVNLDSAPWGLTFDMSGGPKGAKRPLGRPLDGGVRCRLHEYALERAERLAEAMPAIERLGSRIDRQPAQAKGLRATRRRPKERGYDETAGSVPTRLNAQVQLEQLH